MLAEHMEGGGVVLNGESESDKFLVGGGKLISSMILGVASGRKGGGGNEAKKPATTPVELPGGGKGVIDGAKGTGAVVDDTIKALPAPRQIDASWSASTYKKGGLMTGIEHVFYRHGPDSGFANVSKFSQGTSVKDVSSYVDSALRYGKVTPNGPGGHVIEYNAGKVIGTSVSGAPTSTIKINVRDGVIQTAFPY
jgi:filamentous hemagglutinin